MALELQQEKKAQAERERRLKEQEQKIENLTTMVINSAVDDRDLDRRNIKNNRRETWCPRLPSSVPDEKMRETVLEMKELKEESAFAQSAVNKAWKLNSGASQSEDRKGKSLDGWESDGNVKQMRALIQNLELEKIYMEKELDSLKAQSAIQTSSADLI